MATHGQMLGGPDKQAFPAMVQGQRWGEVRSGANNPRVLLDIECLPIALPEKLRERALGHWLDLVCDILGAVQLTGAPWKMLHVAETWLARVGGENREGVMGRDPGGWLFPEDR